MPKPLNPMCQIPEWITKGEAKPEVKHSALVLADAQELVIGDKMAGLTVSQRTHSAKLLRSIPELETARDVAVELAAQYAAERDQLRAELAAQGARVPDGWQLVPITPTDEMVKAVRWDTDAFGGRSAWPSDIYRDMLSSAPTAPQSDTGEYHGLDTAGRVCFYEQDFYVLSNFSSFNLQWCGKVFPTSEHAYHWEKFRNAVEGESDNDRFQRNSLANFLIEAPSAHEAFTAANRWKALRRVDWDQVKVGIMRDILWAKANQHEYVRRKLLATGDRELVENSWRDDYWGWGPNQDGKNMLGEVWMEIRAEIRTTHTTSEGGGL